MLMPFCVFWSDEMYIVIPSISKYAKYAIGEESTSRCYMGCYTY